MPMCSGKDFRTWSFCKEAISEGTGLSVPLKT